MIEDRKIRYGIKWKPLHELSGFTADLVSQLPADILPVWYDYFIERQCLLLDDGDKPPGYEGFAAHAWRMIEILWGDPEGLFYFQRNPNSERMLQAYEKERIVSTAGHASSSKSETLAMLSVLLFLIYGKDIKVLVTAQTLASAEGKIWGKIRVAWQQACRFFGGEQNTTGKMMAGGMIRYQDSEGHSALAGIELVATNAGNAKDSVEKIQGYKGNTGLIFMAGDEWATLPIALWETVKKNLLANRRFRLCACFNPDSFYDAGGQISEPLHGWDSITQEDDEWQTVHGMCIRFDGLKSANVLAGREIYKGLLGVEELESIKASCGGDQSKGFWQMVRGFWSPTGAKDCIYSEREILDSQADHGVTEWLEPPTPILGCDPAYAHGGDGCDVSIGLVGKARIMGKDLRVVELKKVIALDGLIERNQDKPTRITELIKEITDNPEKFIAGWGHGPIQPGNVGIDVTGAAAFGSLLAVKIGSGFHSVNFGGGASAMPVSPTDSTPGSDKFADKASEIWYVGKDLIRAGQIKGLDPDTIREMINRTYYKTALGKVRIESKADMKKRTSKTSPNRADSAFVMLDVARMRHKLASIEKSFKHPKAPVPFWKVRNRLQKRRRGHLVDESAGWAR